MSSLQNITFSQTPKANVNTIQVTFQYKRSKDDPEWSQFTYSIPQDMFSILPDERERIAVDLIFAIARGKGHIDEEGNVTV